MHSSGYEKESNRIYRTKSSLKEAKRTDTSRTALKSDFFGLKTRLDEWMKINDQDCSW